MGQEYVDQISVVLLGFEHHKCFICVFFPFELADKLFYLCPVLTQCRVALRLPGECRALSPLALDNLPLHQLGTGSLFWCVCAAPWARWDHSTPWSKLTIQTTQSHRSLWS